MRGVGEVEEPIGVAKLSQNQIILGFNIIMIIMIIIIMIIIIIITIIIIIIIIILFITCSCKIVIGTNCAGMVLPAVHFLSFEQIV